MQRFEDTQAWQEARRLTRRVYELTAAGPLARDHELRSQMRHTALSSMTNIAAGSDCGGEGDCISYLEAARRSVVKLQSLLYTALDLGYIGPEILRDHYEQAAKTKTLIGDLDKSLGGGTRGNI